MSFANIKSKLQAQEGFTIVELLIVIVVIAILAAITIVSYNGITARANTSSAEATGSMVAKKIEAWNTETNNYPPTFATLTGAAASTSYNVASGSVTLATTALSTSNLPSSPNTINFFKCGHGGSTANPTTTALITNVTGARVQTWNYQTSSLDITNLGTTSGNGGASNTFPINCVISAT